MTEATMTRFGHAIDALRLAEQADPTLRREHSEAMVPGNSYADALAAFRRYPGVRRYFRDAHVADRDAVLFRLIVMIGFIVDADPTDAGPQPLTDAQLAFYRAHKPQLDAMVLTP